jgi:outer membrane protein assembly factor BamB
MNDRSSWPLAPLALCLLAVACGGGEARPSAPNRGVAAPTGASAAPEVAAADAPEEERADAAESAARTPRDLRAAPAPARRLAGLAPEARWPASGGGAGRTGFVPVAGPEGRALVRMPPPRRPRRRAGVLGMLVGGARPRPRPRIGPPAPVDGGFVALGRRGLVALAPDGSERWTQQGREAAPLNARAGGARRGVAADGVLGLRGAARRRSDPHAVSYRQRTPQPAVAVDGSIFGADGRRTFARLDPGGRTRWRYVTEGEVAAGAALAEGRVYVPVNAAGEDGAASLLALDRDGGRIWAAELPGARATAPVVAADGTVLVSSWDPHEAGHGASAVLAFAPDGTERWRADLDAGVLSDVTLASAEHVGVTARSGVLVALGLADGRERWRVTVGDWIGALERPVADAEGVLYASARSGDVVAVAPDGEERWRRDLDHAIVGGLALGPAGDLYAIVSEDLWVLGADGRTRARVRLPRRLSAVSPLLVMRDGGVIAPTERRLYAVPRARVADVEVFMDGRTRCGPMTVRDPAHVRSLAERGCEWIDGSLRLEPEGAVDLTPLSSIAYARALRVRAPEEGLDLAGLEHLERVEYLNVRRSEGPVDLTALARLAAVGRDVDVQANAGLTAFALPALERVGGSLLLRRNPALERLGPFAALRRVGRLLVDDAPRLRAIAGFDALEVTDALRLTELEGLERLSGFGALRAVDRALVVEAAPALARVEGFGRLETVGGTLALASLPRLTTLRAFSRLRSAAAVFVAGTPALARLEGFGALERCEGDLRLHLGALAAAVELGRLAAVGGNLEVGVPAEAPDVTAPRLQGVGGWARYRGRFDAEALAALVPARDASSVHVGAELETDCHRTAEDEAACHACCGAADQRLWSCRWRGFDGAFCACRFPRLEGGIGVAGVARASDEPSCGDTLGSFHR